MKGGHGAGDESADFLVTPQLARRYGVQRIATNNTHGTGCTLSAAMAAGLAKGETLESAVASAKAIAPARSARPITCASGAAMARCIIFMLSGRPRPGRRHHRAAAPAPVLAGFLICVGIRKTGASRP
jgi:hypothetical protein